MNGFRTLTLGIASAVLILFVVGVGYNLLALNLGTVSGDYFLGAAAIGVLIASAWLTLHDLGYIGKWFILAASLVLIGITVKHRAPGVAELFVQSTREADRQALNAALDISAPRRISCDRTTPNIRFFHPETKAPLVWLSEDDKQRIICHDRPGHDPQTGRVYVPVDDRLAMVILMQEPLMPAPIPLPAATPTPEPTPTPEASPITAPTPLPEPTPLPNLGERYRRQMREQALKNLKDIGERSRQEAP